MNEETKEKLLRHGCLACGIACLLLCFIWYLGLILAVAAVVIGFYYAGKYEICGEVKAGMILGGILIVIVLLFLIVTRAYVAFLNIY